MKIKNLDYQATVQAAEGLNHPIIQGRGETIAAGYVATGEGIAAAGSYAGALGNSATTTTHISVSTQQGTWSSLSKARAQADARAQTGSDRSRSSFSARSTYFGFGGGSIQLSSSSAFGSSS